MQAKLSLVALLLVSQWSCGRSDPPATQLVGLHEAALVGNLEAIRQHVANGSNLDEKDAYGSTPLIIAATFDRIEVARALTQAGANLEIGNNDNSTPLHTAAFFCRTEIVKMLLETGADPKAVNNNGHTPLQTVEVPFENVKGAYDAFGAALGPLGLKLDYDQIKTTRPRIAEMLRSES